MFYPANILCKLDTSDFAQCTDNYKQTWNQEINNPLANNLPFLSSFSNHNIRFDEFSFNLCVYRKKSVASTATHPHLLGTGLQWQTEPVISHSQCHKPSVFSQNP
jgi:hypothetical protein